MGKRRNVSELLIKCSVKYVSQCLYPCVDEFMQYLQICNKKAIVECIVLYDVLHKRRIFLDAIGNGLEVLGMCTLISHFPEVFKAAFVSSGRLGSNDVRELLKPVTTNIDIDQIRVWGYLLMFIDQASESGMSGKAIIIVIILVTLLHNNYYENYVCIEITTLLRLFFFFCRSEGIFSVCHWLPRCDRECCCFIYWTCAFPSNYCQNMFKGAYPVYPDR